MINSYRIVLILLGLISAASIAEGKESDLAYAVVNDYGIYKIDSSTMVKVPGGNISETGIATKSKHVDTTLSIPVTKDISFGFRSVLYGLPEEEIELRIEARHPKMNLPDRSNRSKRSFNMFVIPENGAYKFGRAFTLSEDYMLVEGEWNVRVWLDDNKLIDISFQLVKSEI